MTSLLGLTPVFPGYFLSLKEIRFSHTAMFLVKSSVLCTWRDGWYNAGPILVPCRHKGFSDTEWMRKNNMCPHTMCESRKKLSVWAAMKVILDWHFLHRSLFPQLSVFPLCLWLSSSCPSLHGSPWVSSLLFLQSGQVLFLVWFPSPSRYVPSLLAF